MNEDDIGKVFLVAAAWDWTIVGRFVGYHGGMFLFHEAGYFTRTGAPFPQLCKSGFTPETIFNPSQAPNGRLRLTCSINLTMDWEAEWPQRPAQRRAGR